MASYTLADTDRGAYAKTLVAGTVDTVTFARSAESVEVVGDGTAAVYFTVGTVENPPTAPTVGGGPAFELPAGGPSVRTVPAPGAGAPVVKLISSGTPKYSVGVDV
jgi:hypothetical protein